MEGEILGRKVEVETGKNRIYNHIAEERKIVHRPADSVSMEVGLEATAPSILIEQDSKRIFIKPINSSFSRILFVLCIESHLNDKLYFNLI